MFTPNEFPPSTPHTFHHDGVGSLIIQSTNSNSNVPPHTPNSNNGSTHLNGNRFISNSLGYDVRMLPFLHHNSQQPVHFNASTFTHEKTAPQLEITKQISSPLPSTNSRINYSTGSTQDNVYWSQQPQLSPFGVLPHEIASEGRVDELEIPYENLQQNNYFPVSQLSVTPNECNKSTRTIISDKTKELHVKRQSQYIPKSIIDVKSNTSILFGQENTGVISYSPVKIDQSKKYKGHEVNSELVPNLCYKNELVYSNMQAPVVKYASKPVQKQPDNGSSLAFQIIPNGGCSSPTDSMRHHGQSKPLPFPNINSVPQSSEPLSYREMRDVTCHNIDKNEVTSDFFKLPADSTEVDHLNQKTPFVPSYTYDNSVRREHEKRVEAPRLSTSENTYFLSQSSGKDVTKTATIIYEQAQQQQHQIVQNHEVPYSYQYNVLPNNELASVIEQRTMTMESESESNRTRKTQNNLPLIENSPGVSGFQNRDSLFGRCIEPHHQANTNFVVDNGRYEPQFYSEGYNVNTTTDMPLSTHQHETVISSTRVDSSLVNSHQFRQQIPAPMSSVAQSTYLSSFQTCSDYGAYDFVNDELHDQSFNEVGDISSAQCPEASVRGVTANDPRVVVPNIEEEFQFLFDPRLPNYNEVATNERLFQTQTSTASFHSRNVNFLASYIKFLENNCESLERLTDGNSSLGKSWHRNKPVYQTAAKDAEQSTESEKQVNTNIEKVERSFENDPRYYPMPKSTHERRLADSSSDEEGEEKKKHRLDIPKKSAVLEKTNNVTKKKETNEVKVNDIESQKNIKQVAVKSVTIKCKKLKKRKMKMEAAKSKTGKLSIQIEDVKDSIEGLRKTRQDSRKETSSRKISERKAKVDTKNKIKKAMDTDNESQASSGDSDPLWTPQDDDDDCGENITKRKSSRLRMGKSKSDDNSRGNVKDDNTVVFSRIVKTQKSKKSQRPSVFYIRKNWKSSKRPALWKLKNGQFQKFKQMDDEKRRFYSLPEYVEKSSIRLNKYQQIDVCMVEKSKNYIVVELPDEMDIPTDANIKENFMRESLCYENNFAIYVQTLISQALDSNFLDEIVKENDTYFLNNMKVIDDVTSTYLNDLMTVIQWGSTTINFLAKTWPFMSIENNGHNSRKGEENKCSCCSSTNPRQTAVFYGQPYQPDTLQGCNLNIPNNLNKTVNLCKGCAKKIQLFNKIWHQKYHVFVECAKYISRKKSEDKNKVTTDILNELLADVSWLSKLFYDIRNTWLLIWTLVKAAKKKN